MQVNELLSLWVAEQSVGQQQVNSVQYSYSIYVSRSLIIKIMTAALTRIVAT